MAYNLGNDWKMYLGTSATLTGGNFAVLKGEQNSSLSITSAAHPTPTARAT